VSGLRKYERQDLTLGADNQESRERLRELILFIAERCQDDPTFGATKLAKILFRADFISFARYGESITNTSYQKLPHGPVPTAVASVRGEMLEKGEIVMTKEGYSPYLRDRVIPLREANLDGFKARDIALIDGVIEMFHAASASDISRFSHDKAWQAARDYETIPYEAALLSDAGPTEQDIARARELNDEYG
jgi:Antitoxin SocA-like, Panacea domain